MNMINKKVNSTYYINKSVERMRELKQEIANKQDELNGIIIEIKSFMEQEGADALMDPEGVRLIGILQERGGTPKLDASKLKEEMPKVYEAYLKNSETYKVFMPK